MELHQIKSAVKEVFSKRDEVLLVYIYGSFLKTQFYNDIDIGIVIKDEFNQDLLYETRIAREIEKKIQFDIDLRVLNGRPLRFLYSVLQNSRVLFCRNEAIRINFEEKITKEYLDLKPHHDLYETLRGIRYVTG